MREEIVILNPRFGKGKQIAGVFITLFGLLFIFVSPPLGIVIVLFGGIINVIGRAQRWYNWK